MKHTAWSRARTADITASCIDGNITWRGIASMAPFPEEFSSLLIRFAVREGQEYEIYLFAGKWWFIVDHEEIT